MALCSAGKLLGTVRAVAEMAARGFGLQPDAFSSRMEHAPHLLAPTGTALSGRLVPCPAALTLSLGGGGPRSAAGWAAG
jgi:hypothetical protein